MTIGPSRMGVVPRDPVTVVPVAARLAAAVPAAVRLAAVTVLVCFAFFVACGAFVAFVAFALFAGFVSFVLFVVFVLFVTFVPREVVRG